MATASNAGAITKTGNAHLRRVLVEAAWTYQHRPNVQGPSAEEAAIAGSQRGSQADRLEGAAAAAQALHRADGPRQESQSGCDGARPRTAGLHVGHRRTYRSAIQIDQGGLTCDVRLDSSADDSRGPTKRRTLDENCAERSADPTRELSPRQLPTDHVHAVSTRAYQCDQSSR